MADLPLLSFLDSRCDPTVSALYRGLAIRRLRGDLRRDQHVSAAVVVHRCTPASRTVPVVGSARSLDDDLVLLFLEHLGEVAGALRQDPVGIVVGVERIQRGVGGHECSDVTERGGIPGARGRSVSCPISMSVLAVIAPRSAASRWPR